MSKTDLVVYGAGGMGREVMYMIESAAKFDEIYNILGYVDDSDGIQGTVVNEHVVVGDISWLLSRSEKTAVVIAIGNPLVRKSIYEKLKANPLLIYPSIIADDAKISKFVKMGQGCIICDSNIITVNIEIGDFLISNLDCTVCHDSVIGDFVTLNPSVNVSGNVKLGDCTNIGVGTNIIQGISIGENTIIGAGAVVVNDIPADCTAVGVPAKPIKFH